MTSRIPVLALGALVCVGCQSRYPEPLRYFERQQIERLTPARYDGPPIGIIVYYLGIPVQDGTNVGDCIETKPGAWLCSQGKQVKEIGKWRVID